MGRHRVAFTAGSARYPVSVEMIDVYFDGIEVECEREQLKILAGLVPGERTLLVDRNRRSQVNG
jgi:hypothetical protein